MSKKFYVGCRVQYVRGPVKSYVALGLSFIGMRGTITGSCFTDIFGDIRWPVRWDTYGPAKADEDWLEPIWPGSEKIAWSECAWQPVKEPA